MELREPSVQHLDIWKGIGQSVEVLERSGVRSCENHKVGAGMCNQLPCSYEVIQELRLEYSELDGNSAVEICIRYDTCVPVSGMGSRHSKRRRRDELKHGQTPLNQSPPEHRPQQHAPWQAQTARVPAITGALEEPNWIESSRVHSRARSLPLPGIQTSH